MEKTAKQRLIEFIIYLGISQGKFERICGMSNGYINNLKKTLGAEKLQNVVANFPQLNTEWLLYGKGEMLKNSQPASTHIGIQQNNVNGSNFIGSSADIPYAEQEDVERAPIISGTLARAPMTDILEVVTERSDELEKSPIMVFHSPVTLWYRVQDESLHPKYEIGDVIALWAYPKGQEDPIPGKMYGINTSTNGLIIRKLYPQPDGSYIAKALDRETYPDYAIKKDNVIQIYKIIVMVRY